GRIAGRSLRPIQNYRAGSSDGRHGRWRHEQGSAKAVEVTAHELDTAFVGDAAVLVGAIEIGAAVLSDFERGGFVFVSDAHQEIVEAVRPDFPCEIGERAVMGVEIVHAGGVFAGTGRNGGDELAAIVVDAEKIEWGAA